MRWRSYCVRMMKVTLAITLILVGNNVGFRIAVHCVKLGMSEPDLRRALWPYGVEKKIHVGDSWDVLECSPFLWSGFMRPANMNVSEENFQDKPKATEILLDKNGFVCAIVQVGKTREIPTNLGPVKGSSIRDYLAHVRSLNKKQ